MNKRRLSHLRGESLHGRWWVGFGRKRRMVRKSWNWRRGRSLVRRRDHRGVLRRSTVRLGRHGHILLHGRRRRPAVCGGGRISHGHVRSGRHAAGLVLLRYRVVRRCSVGRHIWVRVHLVAHLVHVRRVLVVIVRIGMMRL